MATITSITPFTSAAQNGQGGNVPVPAGTNRKLLAMFTRESSATITALTFDGTAFLANIVAGASIDSTAGPNLGCATYYYDIPDNVVAGDYAVLFSQSASVTTRRVYCVMLTDAAPGAPGWAGETFLDGVGTGMTFDLTDVTAGAAVIAAYANDGASITVLWGADVVQDYDEIIGTAYCSSLATADEVTAGTKTIATTASASDAAREQVLVAVAIANLSGPTISTQPSAATAIVSPSEPAVFTVDCAAAVTGVVWQDDGTNISGADIGQVDTLASGTSVLTVTPTATTRTGSAITAECTDASGMTESSAATLTVRAGVTETQVSETTDASGEVAGTLKTDVQGDALEKMVAFVAIKVNGTELVGPGMWLVGLAP